MSIAWLLTTLIKATALLVAVAAAAAIFRRASASLRHLLWTAGIVGVLALPLLTLALPWRLAVLPRMSAVEAAQAAGRRGSEAGPLGESPQAGADAAVRRSSPAAERSEAASQHGGAPGLHVAPASDEPIGGSSVTPNVLSPMSALVGVWAIVATLFLVRLLLGSAVLARAIRRATPLTTRDWTRPLLEAADRLGVPRLPRLVLSDRLPMPYACGIWRPTIVLPAGADEWTDRQRRIVLCHELAHVRRFDLALNALGQVACALWWFHPLVWIAARNLRTESERACDDLVLNVGTRASEYADHLLNIVSRAARARTPAVALPMAQRHEFEGRMLAILERGARRAPTSLRQSAAVLAAALVVVLPLVAASPADPADSTVPTGTTDTTVPTVPMVGTETTVRTETTLRTDTLVMADTTETTRQPRDGTVGTVEPARTALAQDSNRVAAALINALVRDSVASVRKNAAYALGEMEAQSAVMPLSDRLLNDPSPAVREMAGWALGQLESRAATKALSAAALQDSSENVRTIAVWALGQIEDPSSITPLASVIGRDRVAEVRQRAAWALGRIGATQAPPTLTAALRDTVPDVRVMVAWALGQIGDSKVAPALAEALKDQSAEVRRAAFWALGQMSGEVAQAALVDALESPDPDVRAQAARALGGGHTDPWPWPWPMPLFNGHADGWSKSKDR